MTAAGHCTPPGGRAEAGRRRRAENQLAVARVGRVAPDPAEVLARRTIRRGGVDAVDVAVNLLHSPAALAVPLVGRCFNRPLTAQVGGGGGGRLGDAAKGGAGGAEAAGG